MIKYNTLSILVIPSGFDELSLSIYVPYILFASGLASPSSFF